MPGGRRRLLEIIGEMLPEIKLDPQPLMKEAEAIEQADEERPWRA